MIDTHCHLTFPQLIDRVDDVVADAEAAGVGRMITIGTTPADGDAARDIAERFDNVWFAAGVHPHYALEVDESDLADLPGLLAHPRCVAFGEMGVDYHYDDPPRDVQHRLFALQLEMVASLGDNFRGVIVIHCRKAVDDTLSLMRESGIPGDRFVFHCHTEPPAECRKVLDFGCAISFTGIVTYKNAPEVRESALLVPDDRIMVETDAPYLSPEPHRKVRPNQPKFVTATAAALAELRGMTAESFEQLTDANARRIYGLPVSQ
jgi:TatD DNase family protein